MIFAEVTDISRTQGIDKSDRTSSIRSRDASLEREAGTGQRV